jgi:hypothetical protein
MKRPVLSPGRQGAIWLAQAGLDRWHEGSMSEPLFWTDRLGQCEGSRLTNPGSVLTTHNPVDRPAWRIYPVKPLTTVFLSVLQSGCQPSGLRSTQATRVVSLIPQLKSVEKT